jgi:hypothetical protein
VAFAPRAFAGDARLPSRGARTVVVDLTSGRITYRRCERASWPSTPGCGHAESVVFTQEGGSGAPTATRLVTVDAATAKITRSATR